MSKIKEAKTKLEIKKSIYVSWCYNSSFGDRGDPITTKLKDIPIKNGDWKNVFLTLPARAVYRYSSCNFTSIRCRVYKIANKFYVNKEDLERDFSEQVIDYVKNNFLKDIQNND